MFLALLNEREKKYFLGMAYNLATIDGDYSDSEKNMIDCYCQELQCQFDEKTMVKPMDELIDIIKADCNEMAKKIFVFELVGLAMTDGNYDNDEKKIISQMIVEYNIDPDFANKCENILNEYISFQRRISEIVLL